MSRETNKREQNSRHEENVLASSECNTVRMSLSVVVAVLLSNIIPCSTQATQGGAFGALHPTIY